MGAVHNLPASPNMTPGQALAAAQRDFSDVDGDVIILSLAEDGDMGHYSSHMSLERALFILEKTKLRLLGAL